MKNVTKSFPIILLLCLIISCISITVLAAERGDINSDGTVNASDALEVLKHAAKITTIDTTLGDINKNNSVDATDALFILKYAAKIIPDLSDETINATPAPTPTAVPVASNISNLKKHVKTNGTEDPAGEYYIGYGYEDERLSSYISYYENDDLLQLELIFYEESSSGEIMVTSVAFPLTGSNGNSVFYAAYEYGDYYEGFEAEAPIKIKTTTANTTFNYTETYSENINSSDKSLILENANLLTSDAFIIWDDMLKSELGYGLNMFGFTSFTY